MPGLANALMTFAEFERLPDPPGGWFELHHGELVQVPPPFLRHSVIQEKIAEALREWARGKGFVGVEVGFRATPDYECRRADVAFIDAARFESVNLDGYFPGAPDLVIEVLSKSNTASEMLDKQTVCLANGAKEFWAVDPARRKVYVFTSAGRFSTYTPGEKIPLLFGGELLVERIFDVIGD